MFTGLLFGLTPAFRATKTDLATDLKERTSAPAGFHRVWRPRAVLVMAQVAFSLVALIGAGLFTRSLRSAGQIDPGFDAAHLGIVVYNVTDQGYSEARGREYHQRALQKAASVHGVVTAALGRDVPFHVSSTRTLLLPGEENAAVGQGRSTLTSVVSPGYFQTMGIPLLRGRDFHMADTKTTPRVVIVNQTAATALLARTGPDWPAHQLCRGGTAGGSDRHRQRRQITRPSPNRRNRWFTSPWCSIIFRPPCCMCGRREIPMRWRAVRRELQALDGNLLLQVESLETSVRELLWAQRLSAGLLAVFGALALLLATVGIYGVISYLVAAEDAGDRSTAGLGRHGGRRAKNDSAGRRAAGGR